MIGRKYADTAWRQSIFRYVESAMCPFAYGTYGLYFGMECDNRRATAVWTPWRRQRVWHGMQRDNRCTEIRAFCLAMHEFYVFNKPVMRIFRVVLRCKYVTNTPLMCLSSTRPVMYLLHTVYVAKTSQCIRFTSSTRPEMCLFHIVLRRKFVRNSHVSLANVCLLRFEHIS